jgi:hypothetical protein
MSRIMRFGLFLTGYVLLLAAASVQAAWIEDGVPLCTASTFEIDPVMVPDGQGGAIVVWWDYRSGTDPDLYAGRVDANGNALWGTNGAPVCVQPGGQFAADIVSDGAGGAIITWHDERSGDYAWDIYAQRIDANGNPRWAVNGVLVCGATNYQTYPRLTSDGQNGAIIVWEDERGNVAKNLYAQRVNGDGGRLWTTDGVAVCTAAATQQYPVIVSDDFGGVFIAWQDARTGGSNYWDIYVQKVNRFGVPQWASNGLPVCVAAGDQQWPAVVSDGVGGAIFAWSDKRSGVDYDIYARRVTQTTGPIWTADGVAQCVAPGNQYSPQLASDGQQGAILTWRDGREATPKVYAQRVAGSGTVLWPIAGVVICAAGGNQVGLGITSDGLGGAILVWEDLRNGTGAEDIYAQRVNGAGNTLWSENGKAISDAPYGQRGPTLAPDGDGGAIVAWYDNRANGNWDIYAQSTAFSGSTAVDDGPESGNAEQFSYPNPSQSSTQIAFQLKQPGAVSMRIYDVSGKLVRAIAAEHRDTGRGTVFWDGRNDRGQDVPDGVYLCQVSGPGLELVRKVTRAR